MVRGAGADRVRSAMAVLTGYRALITGASSGIGREIARSLARRGAHVVLAARRGAELRALADELRAAYGVEADAVEADLASADGPTGLWAAARSIGEIDILVNNAGSGYFARFDTTDPARSAALLALNIGATVALCHAFVADAARPTPRPAGRRRYILNVGSILAWQATPHFAVYGASKAFVRDFSEALHVELRERDIAVACLCPGGTRTEFHAVAGAGNYGRLANAAMLDAATVAEAGVRAMLAGRRTVVTGVGNQLTTVWTRLAPRRVATWMSTRVLGRPGPDAP